VRPEVSPPRKGWGTNSAQARTFRGAFPASLAPHLKFEISNLKFIPKPTFEVTYPSGTTLTEARQLWKPRIRINVAHLFRGEAFHNGRLAEPCAVVAAFEFRNAGILPAPFSWCLAFST